MWKFITLIGLQLSIGATSIHWGHLGNKSSGPIAQQTPATSRSAEDWTSTFHGRKKILVCHVTIAAPPAGNRSNGSLTWTSIEVEAIGTRSSVLARLWKTLGRLDNQRVALQGRSETARWLKWIYATAVKSTWICSRSRWHGNTMSWLSIGWWTTGWYNIITYLLDKLWHVSKFGWVTDIHMVQMAIGSCDGVHLKRGCENFPLAVRWIHLVPTPWWWVQRWWLTSPLHAPHDAAFTGDDETQQRYGFHLLCVLWLHGECDIEYVEWNGKSIYFPSPSSKLWQRIHFWQVRDERFFTTCRWFSQNLEV